MAEFVGAFAASHAPLIARDWDRFPAALQARFTAAYRALGERLDTAAADVIITVAPDHWVNFFLNNLPSVCIGVGAQNDGPPEPFMRAFPHSTLAGAPALATHLLNTAMADGFEPSISHQLTLDHGFCIPLWKMDLKRMPLILPLVINGLEPPMISLGRCAAWGRLLAKSIRTYPGDLRVAILATGGLSHSIGEASMGLIEEDLDRRVIELLRGGDIDALAAFLDKALPGAGNGGHEMRNWMVAHAAAEGRGFELIDYFPSPEVYVGCAFAAWPAGQSVKSSTE